MFGLGRPENNKDKDPRNGVKCESGTKHWLVVGFKLSTVHSDLLFSAGLFDSTCPGEVCPDDAWGHPR